LYSPSICDILFLVSEGNNNMINKFDELSCEEVFELNEMCDEWLNEAIEAQDEEMQVSEK